MGINFFLIVSFLVCLAAAAATQSDYKDYHQQWQKVVPPKLVVDATGFASKEQKCGVEACQYYYYLYENADLAKEASRNRTVLIVSGLEGDESLGPYLLFKTYGKIAAARIIFFPMANPSGYAQGTKTTFPNKIDVLQDIPLNNQLCNKTSAFKIIEHLYLKYTIDLSIFVHEDTSIISHPWTRDYSSKKITKTEDYQLYADVADMLEAYDMKNHPTQHQLKSKQVDDTGSLVDWAYGASHYPDLFSKSCNGKTFPKYPNNAMNGLVFSVGLGNVHQTQASQQQTNNLLERALTIITKLISLTNPQISVNVKDNSVTVFIEGCKTGVLSYLKLTDDAEKIVLQKKDETIVRGDVTGEQMTPSSFQADVTLPLPSHIKYEAKFKCGDGWIGQGKTIFAKMREFTAHGQVNAAEAQQIIFEQAALPLQTYQIVLAVILLIVAAVWGMNCVRTGMKLRRARKLSQFNEKFQQIEYVEDVEAFETGLEPKPESHDDRSTLTE